MHNWPRKPLTSVATAALIVLSCRDFTQAQETVAGGQSESPQQRRGFGPPERGVYKARIAPHWLTNNTQFWYRNDLRGGAKEFILVDAEKGSRSPAFDHAKLASGLSQAAETKYTADHL